MSRRSLYNISSGTINSTNVTSTNIVGTNVSSGTLNLSTGLTSSSAQITNANVTTSTIGTARVITSLLATGNSNTIGSIITTGGNVGIGTTSPITKLQVIGDISSTNYQLENWNNTTLGVNSVGTTTYYKIATLPTTGDLGGSGGLSIKGMIGGWANNEICNIDLFFATRNGQIIRGHYYGGAVSTVIGFVDLHIRIESNFTHSVYLKCNSFFKFDLIVSGNGLNVNLLSPTSTGTTSPTGSVQTESVVSALQMYNVAGNIGIGATAPANTLQIGDVSRTSINSLGIINSQGSLEFGIAVAGGQFSTSAVAGDAIIRGAGNRKLLIQNGSGEAAICITGGNVGISTASPVGILDVRDTTNFVGDDGGALYITGGTNGNRRLHMGYANSANYGWIESVEKGNNLTNLSLQPRGGNVGIGTSSPLSTISIFTSNNAASNIESGQNGLAIQSGTTNNVDMILYMGADKTNKISYIQSVLWGVTTNPLILNARGGNVGIATTAPSTTLDVSGTARITTSLTTGTVNSTNLTSTNIVGTNISSGTLNLSTGLTSASAQVTNANITTSTISTLRNTNAVSTNITSTNIISTALTAASMKISENGSIDLDEGSLSRLALIKKFGQGPSIAIANNTPMVFQVANSSIASAVTTNSYSTIMTLTTNGSLEVSSVTAGGLFSSNVTSTNVVATNLSAGALALSNINVSTATIGSLLNNRQSIVGTLGSFINLPRLMMYGSGDTNNPLYYFSVLNSENIGSGYGAYVNTAGTIRMSTTSTSWLIGKSTGSLAIIKCDGSVGSLVTTPDVRFIIETTGNVGIATTSPTYTLDVSGTFETSNSNGLMLFASSGNLGIGTSSPSAELHILESTANGSNPSSIFIDKNGERSAIQVWNYNNTKSNLQIGSNVYWNNVGSAVLQTTAGGAVGWSIVMGSNSDNFTLGRYTATNTGSDYFSMQSSGSTLFNILPGVDQPNYIRIGRNDNTIRYHDLEFQTSVTQASSYMAVKLHSGTTFNAQAEVMRLRADGRVGIGTTAPSYTLDVAGNGRFTGTLNLTGSATGTGIDLATNDRYAEMRVIRNSTYSLDKDMYLQWSAGANSKLFLYSNNTETMTLNGGNVGIGTNAPSSKLEVDGTVRIDGPAGTGTNGCLLITGRDSYGHSFYIGSYAAQKRLALSHTGTQGQLFVYDYGSGGAQNLILQAPGGNVGIGNITPTSKLQVNGDISAVGTVNSFANMAKIAMYTSNDTTNPLIGFTAYNTESMGHGFGTYVNSSGIITMSASSTSWLIGKSVSGLSIVKCDGNIGSAATQSTRMFFATSGNIGIGTVSAPAYLLTLGSDSAAKPSTNTWTVSSDARLKTNITLANLDTCYNTIKNIPLKRYTWLDEVYTSEEVPDRSKLGWIAQDVETLLPKSVEQKDMFGYSDCRTLNSDQIIASLYGAVQKLIEKVEQLESQLNNI